MNILCTNSLRVLLLVFIVGLLACTNQQSNIHLTDQQIREEQRAYLEDDLHQSGVSVLHAGEDSMLVLPADKIFLSDSASLNEANFRILNTVAAYLKLFDIETIKVAGYTDNSTVAKLNDTLSKQQAQVVADYIAREGIGVPIVYAIGYGARSPIASNENVEEQQKNKRIQITYRRLYLDAD